MALKSTRLIGITIMMKESDLNSRIRYQKNLNINQDERLNFLFRKDTINKSFPEWPKSWSTTQR